MSAYDGRNHVAYPIIVSKKITINDIITMMFNDSFSRKTYKALSIKNTRERYTNINVLDENISIWVNSSICGESIHETIHARYTRQISVTANFNRKG